VVEDGGSVTEDQAFRQLYERESAAVFHTVYLLCGDRALAQDATQEAFARAFERWRRLRGKPWVGGWLTSTAVNAARRALRRRPTSVPPPSEERDLDAALDLWRSVRFLPLRQQQAVILRYRLDMSMAEVGSAMGCDAGTVRTHLARARETLRARMGGLDVRR
jgi:RNA polymerase sigma-70 factor (ECF subfamily)